MPALDPDIFLDVANKLAIIDISLTSITIQKLYNGIAARRAEPDFLDNSRVVVAEGKAIIPGQGTFVIVLTMQDGWRVQFAPRPGPTTVATQIIAGVLVDSAGANPVAPSAFTSNTAFQAVTGLALQQLELTEIHRIFGLDAAAPLVESAGARDAGTLHQDIAEDVPAVGSVTVTRTP